MLLQGCVIGPALSKAELRRDKPGRGDFARAPRRPIRVVLDGVRHAYNVGALLRLCDAFACERLVVCGGEAGGDRRLIQAAAGTQRWVAWERQDCAVTAVRAARAARFRIVAVEQTHEARALADVSGGEAICLVFGSEREGISPAVLACADAAVAIPMAGMANSLNVATAAAIVLHAVSSTVPLGDCGGG